MLWAWSSDIKDFTSTTADMQPEDLTAMLNRYFTAMSKIALAYDAHTDKFIGDAMQMFFGDPETRGAEEDARACVRMAVAMQRQMVELQQEWRASGFEQPFEMRVGRTLGEVRGMSAIGTNPNLPSRLRSDRYRVITGLSAAGPTLQQCNTPAAHAISLALQ